MKSTELEIIKQYSTQLSSQYTINQIAKRIKKSYGNVYSSIGELIKKGVITAKTIGHSTLCSLNVHNDYTLSLLISSSIEHKLKVINPKIQKMDSLIQTCTETCHLHFVYIKENMVFFVGDEKIRDYFEDQSLPFSIKIESLANFQNQFVHSDANIIILYGFEEYYRIVRDIK